MKSESSSIRQRGAHFWLNSRCTFIRKSREWSFSVGYSNGKPTRRSSWWDTRQRTQNFLQHVKTMEAMFQRLYRRPNHLLMLTKQRSVLGSCIISARLRQILFLPVQLLPLAELLVMAKIEMIHLPRPKALLALIADINISTTTNIRTMEVARALGRGLTTRARTLGLAHLASTRTHATKSKSSQL